MLTAKDISERIGLTLREVAYCHAKRILPEPVRVGGECRWRVEDVELFEDYLRARIECRDNGIDPDSPDGPGVPVYSMGLSDRFDPRQAMQRIHERERQGRSRTLAAGSEPIPRQERVEMPEAVNEKTRTEATNQ